MATFFIINDTDISSYVASFKIDYATAYNAQSNAAGDTVVDVVNNKRTFNITTRHLTDCEMALLLTLLSDFNINIGYRDAKTKELITDIDCIVSSTPQPEYYTLQDNTVVYKPITLTFKEL